jgi:hypothetical protein
MWFEGEEIPIFEIGDSEIEGIHTSVNASR